MSLGKLLGGSHVENDVSFLAIHKRLCLGRSDLLIGAFIITVGKVNVDDENALAMKYGVMSIPTLIVFKDGKEKTRIVGARPKAAILAELV